MQPEVPKRQEKKQQERKQTQYLTRFDHLPTSLGQEKENLLIQQSSTSIFRDTIHEGSTPIFIIRESQGFRKP